MLNNDENNNEIPNETQTDDGNENNSEEITADSKNTGETIINIESDEKENTDIELCDEIISDEPDKNKRERTIVHEFFEWIEIFASVLTVLIIIFTFAFRLVTVKGESMEKTLTENENLIISHLLYQPKQNDIVVIQIPSFSEKTPLIKRVIATEGQTVDFDFDNWKVIVDGVPLDEPYVNYIQGVQMRVEDVYSLYELPLTVEKGKIFVLGDNRNNSKDSRDADIQQVDARNVVGRVLIRVFPFNKIGAVKPNVE